MRLSTMWRIIQIEEDNIYRGWTQLFIQNILKFLTSLPPRILHVSSKLWPIFTQFQDINRVFFADIPQK